MKRFVLFFVLALMIISCAKATSQPTTTPIPSTATPVPPTVFPITLSSSAFTEGQEIPVDYSCKGTNISPALTWTEPPAGTQSLAIIMYDSQASWTHWALYNIPASTHALKKAIPTDPKLSDGSMQAKTSFGKPGYGGPCPPSKHIYVFTLYALDGMLSVPTSAFSFELDTAMKGHILASTELTGTFTP